MPDWPAAVGNWHSSLRARSQHPLSLLIGILAETVSTQCGARTITELAVAASSQQWLAASLINGGKSQRSCAGAPKFSRRAETLNL